MQVTPRIYQEVAVKAAIKGLRSRQKRALVVLATGLGKTLTVAFIAKKMCSKKVLFLVHNNFILKHAIDEFRLVFDEKTKMAIYNGMSKNGAKEADIVFATWQTMGKNLEAWGGTSLTLSLSMRLTTQKPTLIALLPSISMAPNLVSLPRPTAKIARISVMFSGQR